MTYASLEEMVLAAAEAVRPPERITVSQAAERYHIIKMAGQHSGPFSLGKTPYLQEPMDVLTSLDHTGMVFVGPARTGKSAMFINWLCHTAITDPADMMLVHMSQNTARTWSQEDLARAIRNSPDLAARMRPGRQNDNVYDKKFLSGMGLEITWPTIKNLSGKTKRYCWIMDADRIKPQIVENEGHVWDLTKKRTGTYKRYGMTVAEASPGFPVSDAKWIQPVDEPHAAPPADGILALYNRGDRRRWYWQCLFCGDWFEPRFKLMRWPNSTDHMEAAEQAHMACPHCFEANKDPFTFSMLPELNAGARWIREGQRMIGNELVGKPRRSDIASFWMFGPAAGLATDWKALVLSYLQACDEYEKTGSEGNLMTTVTVDQGEAYVPKALEGGMLPEVLKARAEDWGGHDENGIPFVPAGVRFLIGTIDVQAGGRPSFVVHIFGIGEGFDIYHVDMFKITKAARRDDATNERHGLDPAAYPEDWDVLKDQVLARTYPLADGSGRRMALKLTVCDSGGKDGVTRNAYEFYRRLRSAGEAKRFHLVKGSPSKTETATIRHTLPDAQQKDKMSIARGDVPVWLINSNIVKDTASNMLHRAEPGGMVHFPAWAADWLYSQLTTEIRMPDGWKNPNQRRNEAFDLLAYCIAACDLPDIRIRFLDWEKPPGWAAPWDTNDLVTTADGAAPFSADAARPKRTLAELAKRLG